LLGLKTIIENPTVWLLDAVDGELRSNVGFGGVVPVTVKDVGELVDAANCPLPLQLACNS
jgi:hypothetical protein